MPEKKNTGKQPKQDIKEKIQDDVLDKGAPQVQILPELPPNTDTGTPPQPPPETPTPPADTPQTPPPSTPSPPKQETE